MKLGMLEKYLDYDTLPTLDVALQQTDKHPTVPLCIPDMSAVASSVAPIPPLDFYFVLVANQNARLDGMTTKAFLQWLIAKDELDRQTSTNPRMAVREW